MSFFKLFSGPTAEALEQKGDACFQAGRFGQALQAFEHAVYRIEKQAYDDTRLRERIVAKIRDTKEALAREHQQNACHLIEGGYFDEARELLVLAMEISPRASLTQALRLQLEQVEEQQVQDVASTLPSVSSESRDPEDSIQPPDKTSDEDYFLALCGALPDSVQENYRGYGERFKAGYVALNRGHFGAAVEHLTDAMAENPQADTYIPLELATAYVNLDRISEAQEMLEHFIGHHPEALPAYQLLCDIYWEQNEFGKVDALLDSIPAEFTQSRAVYLLKGETLFRAGRIHEARNLYLGFVDTYGWDETIARHLASVNEALGEFAGAVDIYREILGRCNSCQARIDPVIKHKYAELCFKENIFKPHLVEMYLDLAREIPENAATYFDRVSRIYTTQGNRTEAARFRALAHQATKESRAMSIGEDDDSGADNPYSS